MTHAFLYFFSHFFFFLNNSLKTRPVVEKLVSYMVEAPGEDADAKREFKYPYLACEIFCCEIDAVFSTLVENDCELFGKMLSFVDVDGPLNSMLASYFSKTVGCLVLRRQSECMAFLQREPKYLDRLVDHVRVLAVAEVLLRLVGADDPGVMLQGMMMHSMHGGDSSAWLTQTPLLDRLLDALGSSSRGGKGEGEGDDNANASGAAGDEGDATQHANAAEVLVGIARRAPSALASQLAGKDSIRKLFSRGLGGTPARYGETTEGGGGVVNDASAEVGVGRTVTAHNGESSSPLVNVLDIAIAVIDAKRAAGATQSMQAFLAMESAEPPTARSAPPEALEGCLEFLPQLVKFIDIEGDHSVMRTTWGTMSPPLGLKRVKVVDLLATLVSSHNDAVAAAVLESGALPVCCKLFARYPFNNFLHHHVESMITSILEWGHPKLVAHLFASQEDQGCDVIGLITGAAQTVETVRGPMRAGNLGHVTRIGNKLASIASGNFDAAQAGCDEAAAAATAEVVAATLEMDVRWLEHVEGNLKERNAVENVYRWACGRPAGMDDDGAAGESDADEDMTRDFDIGLGSGFSRDVYHRRGRKDVFSLFFSPHARSLPLFTLAWLARPVSRSTSMRCCVHEMMNHHPRVLPARRVLCFCFFLSQTVHR